LPGGGAVGVVGFGASVVFGVAFDASELVAALDLGADGAQLRGLVECGDAVEFSTGGGELVSRSAQARVAGGVVAGVGEGSFPPPAGGGNFGGEPGGFGACGGELDRGLLSCISEFIEACLECGADPPFDAGG